MSIELVLMLCTYRDSWCGQLSTYCITLISKSLLTNFKQINIFLYPNTDRLSDITGILSCPKLNGQIPIMTYINWTNYNHVLNRLNTLVLIYVDVSYENIKP